MREINTLLQGLSSASLIRRILKRSEVGDKLALFRQRLDTAIDTFHVCLMLQDLHISYFSQITENMRTEDALSQMLAAVKEGEDKRDILFMNSPPCFWPETSINTNLD